MDPISGRRSESAVSERETDAKPLTTVEIRATGHVRRALGTGAFTFAFEGDTLRELLEELDSSHPDVDLRGMLVAESDAEASTRGWASIDALPGRWRKNPVGENTRPFVRVLVNGRFNEHLDGWTPRSKTAIASRSRTRLSSAASGLETVRPRAARALRTGDVTNGRIRPSLSRRPTPRRPSVG